MNPVPRRSDHAPDTATRGASTATVWCFSLILIFAFALRSPNLDREFNGHHDWKNIRHYQFAASMIESGNPLVGRANFNQPETSPPWFWSVTESPWVDWSLILVYLGAGQNLFTFRLLFVLVDVLTIVLLFLVVRHYLGVWLALLGTLIYAMTPVCVYFSGHSVGENFIQAASLLWLVAAQRLVRGPLAVGPYVLFTLASANLVLCKTTTGALMAGTGFLLVNLTLALRHWTEILPAARRHRLRSTVITVALFVAPAALLVLQLIVLDREWTRGQYPIFQAEFYGVMLHRVRVYVGTALLLTAATSAIVYLGIVLRPAWRRTLTSFEHVTLLFLIVTLVQWVIQARAYTAHEYYLLTMVVPAILLTLCLLHRVVRSQSRAVVASVGVAVMALFLYYGPAQARVIRGLYRVENVSRNDRDSLRTFFSFRKQDVSKLFILSDQPRWAFHAGVYMRLAYAWDGLLAMTRNSETQKRYLRDLGLRYIVYPRYRIPPDVLKHLDRDLIVDNGPGHFRLGVVHRGQAFFIFKITSGISRRVPLTQSGLAGCTGRGCVVATDGFTTAGARAEADGVVYETEETGHGAVYSRPFVPRGDAITYLMRGSDSESTQVVLVRDGTPIYSQHPVSSDELRRFTMDTGAFSGSDILLNVADDSPEPGTNISVTAFEEVSYTEPLD